MVRAPRSEDKFSFGLWSVGWLGVDPFGTATRPALDPREYAERLAELGAWGVTFHDNDVFPFGADDATRERICLDLTRVARELHQEQWTRWAQRA